MADIEPVIKHKKMSEEHNFDKDDAVITKFIGGSGSEEESSDDGIALTNYIPGSIHKPLTGSVKSQDRSGELCY